MDLPGAQNFEPVSQSSADPPPDWTINQSDLLCPLCDYNLRGLTEPRCPECGYRFEWQNLIDQRATEHPWLFEHRKRRKILALFHTFLASQSPWYFWRSVQPITRPKPLRLVLYWFILVGILSGVVLHSPCWNLLKYYVTLPYARHQLRLAMEEEIERDKHPSPRGWIVDYYTEDQVAEYGSVAAVARAQLPLIRPWNRYVQEFELRTTFEITAFYIAIGCALWPWLTWCSLLLFQQTIQKAKVRSVHLFRCAIYSSDLFIILALPAAWLLSSSPATLDSHPNQYLYPFYPFAALIIPAGLTAMLVMKLSFACRDYLGLPHAVAVAAASQIIVLLCLLAAAPWYWLR